jgi:hypothetical protein
VKEADEYSASGACAFKHHTSTNLSRQILTVTFIIIELQLKSIEAV